MQLSWIGANAITVTFRRDDSSQGEQVLYPDDEQRLRIAAASIPYAFDADRADFKLIAEALWIRKTRPGSTR